jgi:mRNA-degrading endonuclease RelE of RelBE toxin-antitoxin system
MTKRRRGLPPREAEHSRSITPTISPSFGLRFTEDAAAEIKSLDGSIKKQLRKVLEQKLAVDPEGYGLPLRGPLAGYWKHEFATHRVVYRIYKDHHLVAICAVGPRKQGDAEDIYNQLNAVARTGRLADQLAKVLKNILPETK